MKLKRIRSFLLVSLLPLTSLFASDVRPTKNLPAETGHNWEYFTFPLVAPDLLMFTFGFGDKAEGLQINVNRVRPAFFKTNSISAKLHRANGQVVAPTDPLMLNAPVGIGGLGVTEWGVMAEFPWVTNSLEECWIEISVGSESYWLEIPYGFYRNPKDPLAPSTTGGLPKLAPGMKQLTSRDHMVPWENVHYDLGEIQNHWRLSLIMSNPFYGVSEVVLYREDRKLWDLRTPRTALRILDADESVITGRCVSLRLPEDGMRRFDTFNLNDGGSEDQRNWGQLEVSVDGKSHRIAVPSSLYKHLHGHARRD